MDVPWQQTKAFTEGVPFNLRDGSERSMFTSTKAMEGGLNAAIFALYLSEGWQDGQTGITVRAAIQAQINRVSCDPSVGQVMTLNGLKYFVQTSEWFPVMFGLEGGRLIHNSLERLSELAKRGVKYLTLTHNRNTSWADSATDIRDHGGLTEFGFRVIRRCNNLKVLVDVSHASDETAFDAIGTSLKPVIASHSGVKGLVKQPRNLSNILIKKIAENGGIICVPFVKKFIGHYKIADHINYIAELVGVKHVGIGSDLDGATLIPGFTSVVQWKQAVVPDLEAMGVSQADIDLILGGNLMRVLEAA